VRRIALLLGMYATSGLQYKHTAEVLAMLLTQVTSHELHLSTLTIIR